MTKRKWYAHYSRYGCNSVWSDCGKYTGAYYAFDSKKERDIWVEDHEFDDVNWVARKATRAEVVSQLGKYFFISDYECDNFDGGNLCEVYREY